MGFWKFQVNSMPISTLMTILWGDAIWCFLKLNLLKQNFAIIKTIKIKVKLLGI